MKKLPWFGLALSLLIPVPAMPQSAFDGTWKINLNKSQFPAKPDVYLLQDGMYHCKTCVFPFDVKADGQDHKVSGNPYVDTVNIKVVDARTIVETGKKDGKIVLTETTTISPDGNTATFEFTHSSATDADPVTGKREQTRVARGPAGSHAISGSWRTTKLENVSDNALTFTYKIEGDSLIMTTPTGQSFTAKLDGTEAPYKGDPGTTSVSVKRMGKTTIEETDKRDGKVIATYRMTLAPDGKSMTVEMNDKIKGTTAQFVAEKQ